MKEPLPELRVVILEPVYLHPLDFIEAEAEPLLDCTGNYVYDEYGNIIYAC